MTMKKKGSAIVDMTVGSPTALILGFAIPMLLGTLFQQFYSMADTVIVGRFLSVQALAGVGSTAAINFLINGFVIGMSSGFAIPVAQRFGARDYVDMRKFIANTIWLSLIFSVVVTGLVALFTKQLLILTQTPEDILPYAYQYIFIIFLGIPTTYLYNVTASLIRALGDSKTPVYFLILASVVNIVLDFVSIVGFGFSVNGPALATVFSQAVSGICCIFYMRKKFPLLRFAPREMQFDTRKCGILLSMALPMGLQYSITAIGSVILQSAVNMLGTVTVASVTAGQKISMFFCCVYDALGATMATYAGQNVGAGKLQRVQDGVYVATRIGIAYGLPGRRLCRDQNRHCLRPARLPDLLPVRQSVAAALSLAGSDGDCAAGAALPARKFRVLCCARRRQYMALYDSGHGILRLCDSFGRLGDDCAHPGRFYRRSLLWYLRGILCLAARLALGGLLPDSGLSPLPAETAPVNRHSGGLSIHSLFMISLKKSYKSHMNSSRLFAII